MQSQPLHCVAMHEEFCTVKLEHNLLAWEAAAYTCSSNNWHSNGVAMTSEIGSVSGASSHCLIRKLCS